MIANRKRLKIDFKLRKILPRNKTISENCTNRFLNQKYVDCNHEGTKNYTVPNFFRESFLRNATIHKNYYERNIQSNDHKNEFANFMM